MPNRGHATLTCVVILLVLTALSPAVDIHWNNNAGDGNWSNGSNWSTGAVPTTSTADRAVVPIAAGPVFSSGRSATTYRVLLRGANGTITMNGGSLTTNNYFDIGNSSEDTGTLTINSGSVTTVGTGGHFYCGRAGVATLNMNGGTLNISATMFVARDMTSVATVNLSGGTISCNALSMGLNGGDGLINITSGGSLIINGNATTTVNTYITNEWIKAYNGAGVVQVDYNTTTPGKTTVKASAPVKAGAPWPEHNATNVSVLTALSWTGVLDAISHDVYLGTTSPGDFQANVPEPTFDPDRLDPNTTYYWRIDEVTDTGTLTGDVWSFTTGALLATGPSPANNAINVEVDSVLSWTGGSSAESHNVYFGTTNPPPFVRNQAGDTFDPGALNTDTTYYWRINAIEGEEVYVGPVWSFSTKASFRKGPYLIYPGVNTEMTVLWQVSESVPGSISWGTDNTYSDGTVATTEYGTDHQHRHTITGLTPGTLYYYRVTAGTAQATGTFRAAPADSATKLKFLAYGDTRSNPNLHAQVCAGMLSVLANDPEYQTMLLHSGDWVNAADNENDWTNQFFNRSWAPALEMQASVPIQGCMGNHEQSGTLFRKYYPSYPYVTNRFYFSFDYGPVGIFVIDQYTDYGPGSAQLTWLENELANSNKKWKIIVLHQNGWSAGGSHPNDANVQSRIQPLAEEYGVQVVVGGHNHYYARAVVNGVHHITAGGGGAPLYTPQGGMPNIVMYERTLGFSKFEIDGNTMRVESVRPDNTVLDVFYVEQEEPEFTFIVAADPQMLYCDDSLVNWQETISKVNIVNPAFLVVAGDLLNSPGSQVQADHYLSIADGLRSSIPLYNVAGNHDVHDAPSPASYAWYQERFGDLWYSFTYGNNLFITLETNVLRNASNYPGKDIEQMAWLEATLEDATGYDNIVVFMHHPLAVGSVDEPDMWSNISNPRRTELLDIFHQYGVRTVFNGHWHRNSLVRDGELEIVTVSSCACPLAADPPGFSIVNVYKSHVQHQYYTLDSIYAAPGDFTGDGVVDMDDLGILIENWLKSGRWP